MSAPPKEENPLVIERLSVCADRVIAEIKLSQTTPRFTGPALMEEVCAVYPSISCHACADGKRNRFGDVMNCTSIPHLLEHLVIDVQAHAKHTLGDDRVIFVGNSEWMDASRARARIEVNFVDDVVALRAFCDVVDFLNKIMLS